MRLILSPLIFLAHFYGLLSEGCEVAVPNKRGPYEPHPRHLLAAAVAVATALLATLGLGFVVWLCTG